MIIDYLTFNTWYGSANFQKTKLFMNDKRIGESGEMVRSG